MKPILEVENHMASNVKTMGLKIENCGVGPAIIKEIEIFYKNENLGLVSDGNWVHKISGVPNGTVYVTLKKVDTLIKPGGELWLLKNDEVEKGREHDEFFSLLEELIVSVKYESIYGEKFIL